MTTDPILRTNLFYRKKRVPPLFRIETKKDEGEESKGILYVLVPSSNFKL